MNATDTKNKRRRWTRTLGSGVDEFSFRAVTTLRGLQRRQKYTSDRAEIKALQELAQSQQALQTFDQPAVLTPPEVEFQNQKMPFLLRPLASAYRYTHLTFQSAITTNYPASDVVHAHHLYRPDHKNAPTLLYLHGWMDFSPAICLQLPLRWVVPLGYNLVLLELPHHMHRKSAGTYSGELTLTGNLPAMFTTMQQAISDVRGMLAWLKARGIEHVALAGKSLGGAVSALTLTVEGGFDCAVLFVPAVEPRSSLWHSSYTRTIRSELTQQGIDEEATGLLLEAFRPGRYPPTIEGDKILVIAATGDRVAFSPDVEEFAHAWNANLATIEWGHLTSALTNEAAHLARPFLSRWLPPA